MRVAFIQKNDTITIYEGLDPTIVDEMEADGFLNGHNISIDFDDMFDYEVRIGDYGYDSLFMAMVQNYNLNQIIREEWDLNQDEAHCIDALIDFNLNITDSRQKYYVDQEKGVLAYLSRDKKKLYVTTYGGFAGRFEMNLLASQSTDGEPLRRPMEELLGLVDDDVEIIISRDCDKNYIKNFLGGVTLEDVIDQVDYLINVESGSIVYKEEFVDQAHGYKHLGEGRFKKDSFCFQALKEVKCF